ncbi:MAG: CCA tRNA nucleotidyltransferase [Treponema sp.]
MCEKIEVDKDLIDLANIFKNAGFSLYLVGGALRDRYLKRENYDIDVATDAKPKEVSKLFKKTIPTGIEHGTVTIRFRGKNIECTTLRRDEGYSDARHPDKIVFGNSIIEDLSRRDFTMNAIAASLPDGTIFDPYDGKDDIKASLIRAVGRPLMRFSEDGLRPIRAIRFAGQLGFEIETETLYAICHSLEKIAKVSIERIQEEFNKILKARYFFGSLRLLKATRVFSVFLDEASKIKEEDFEALLSQMSYVTSERLDLRLTVLFSYIYKEEKSIEKIISILKRLKYSNKIVETVSHLVKFCDFDATVLDTPIKIRHFLKDVGKEHINDVLMLKHASILSPSDPCFKNPYFALLEKLQSEIETIIKEKHALSLKELAITGNDLLTHGFKAGPSLGIVLNKLLNVVLEDPSKNQKDELIAIATTFKQ